MRKITPKQQASFTKRCEDYLIGVGAIKNTEQLYDWHMASIYGPLGISIRPSEEMYTVFMRVDTPELAPITDWLVSHTNGKCNIHISNAKGAADGAYDMFHSFVERVKVVVDANTNLKATKEAFILVNCKHTLTGEKVSVILRTEDNFQISDTLTNAGFGDYKVKDWQIHRGYILDKQEAN